MHTAIILAGGLGTRLRETVPNLSKPMAPILDRPFLEYQMDYWIKQGIDHFVLSVGYMKEVIVNHFGNSYCNVSIEYAVEDTPLGTGGGMLNAAQDLTEPFIVLNGDTFFEVVLSDLNAFHQKQKSEWTLSLYRMNQAERYMGVEIDERGRILSMQSESLNMNSLANGGVYLINPSVVNKFTKNMGKKTSLEDDLLPDFMSSGGELFGMQFFGKFIDIGVAADYLSAEAILLQ